MSRIGFALCGSFCTHAAALTALEALLACGHDIQPILSETAFATDTRFGCAAALRERLESLCGRAVIHTVPEAEPLGPARPLDARQAGERRDRQCRDHGGESASARRPSPAGLSCQQ